MKRWIALGITLSLLAAILISVDRARLWEALSQTHPGWFAAALGMFVPQIAVISHRWRQLIGRLAPIGWGESVRLVLASQSMNLVLPSKMGDLAKAWFLKRSGALDLARATQVVVLEKLLDVAALCAWMLAGLGLAMLKRGEAGFGAVHGPMGALAALLGAVGAGAVAALYFVPLARIPFYERATAWLGTKPRLGKLHRLAASSHEVMALLQEPGAGRLRIVGWSLLIWGLHLVQIYFFFRSLGAVVPGAAFVAFMPLALFVGLLPFSIAGIGTRDAAVIFLFGAWQPAAVMAGAGWYLTLRYLVPAAAGLPFLHRYLGMQKE